MDYSEALQKVTEELNAVEHFLGALKTRGKPIRCQDAHSLLVKAPQVKTFLQSVWKLNKLEEFFRKYSGYFIVDANDAVYLKNPDLDLKELECVQFFVQKLSVGGSIPYQLHLVLAYSLFTYFDLDEAMGKTYSLQCLFLFFQRHSDFFLFQNNQISLKCCQGSTDYMDLPLSCIIPKSSLASSNTSLASTEAIADLRTAEGNNWDRQRTLNTSNDSTKTVEADDINCNENRWSPSNPEGRKQYDRPFLLKLQTHPLCLQKPALLHPDLNIIFDTPKLFVLREHVKRQKTSEPATQIVCSPDQETDENNDESKLERLERKKYMRINKRAVKHFKNVLSTHESIFLKDVQQFLRDDALLCESLKKYYDNLKSFFEKRPDIFLIIDEAVSLTAAAKVLLTSAPAPSESASANSYHNHDLPLSCIIPKSSLASSNTSLASTEAITDLPTSEKNNWDRQKTFTTSNGCTETKSEADDINSYENRWSPSNPEGRKQYDRPFLLKLQTHPLCLQKPAFLHPYLNIIFDTPKLFVLREHIKREETCPQATQNEYLAEQEIDQNIEKSELEKLKRKMGLNKKAMNCFKKVLSTHEKISLKDLGLFMCDSLKKYYDIDGLKSFFENRPDVFLIDDDSVSLTAAAKLLLTSTPGQSGSASANSYPNHETNENNDKSKLEKLERRKYNRINRRAVKHFRNVLSTHERISLKDTRQFLQEDALLCESLEKHYDLDDLKLFFEKLPDIFLIVNENVSLTAAKVDLPERTISNLNSEEIEFNRADLQTLNILDNVNLQDSSSLFTALQINENHTTSSPGVKLTQKGDLGHNNVYAFKPEQIHMKCTDYDNKLLPNPAVKEVSKHIRYKDVSCQTISTGPILSLNAFCSL